MRWTLLRAARRRPYALWAETYPPWPHNPLMRVGAGRRRAAARAHPRRRARSTSAPDPDATCRCCAATGARRSSASTSRWRCCGAAAPAPGRVCGDACRLPFAAARFDLINASLMVGDVADLGALDARDGARAGARRPPGLLGLPSVVGAARLAPDVPDARTARCTTSRSTRTRSTSIWRRSSGPGFDVRTIREPRFSSPRDDAEPGIKAFRRRWGNPQVVVVFHAVKEP